MLRRASLLLAFAALLLAACACPASARTLTAKDGRAIEVEILAYEGDAIRIKRTDTGQIFTLPIETFSADDQRALRAEAKEAASKPKPLPPGSVQIELSRGMFSSEKESGVGLNYVYQQWGYNVTLTNRSGRPLEKLRAEYIIFLDPSEEMRGVSGAAKLKRRRGRAELETIAPSARAQFKTDTVEAVKVTLQPGYIWSDSDKKRSMRDKLHGVWVRIYLGDEIIAESTSPGGLESREPWEGADTAGKVQR